MSAAAVILSYFIGAIPLGLLLGKLLKGVDIREYGSGKIGATNVLRTVGLPAAAATFVFDLGKGASAVYIARALADSQTVEALAALAALAGHNWSIFIRFSGGRGIATGIGGLMAMTPVFGVVSIGFGLLVIALSRYVSLGSLTGAAFVLIGLLVLALLGHEPWAWFAYTAVGVPIVFFQHRDNIVRLARGTERKLGQKGERRPASPPAGANV